MDSISLPEKREALERILRSRHFAKTKRVSRFLDFVCEQAVLGKAERLNEYLIGVEIYERGADFDPQQDAIVRVQAHEIRRRLKEYYQEEGKEDSLRVDLPAGHYVPVFHRPAALPVNPVDLVQPLSGPEAALTFVPKRYRYPGGTLVLGLTGACVLLAALLIREWFFIPRATTSLLPTLPASMTWF